MKNINYLSFLITWKCNSRCKMCNIWKENDTSDQEINLHQISELFSNQSLKNLKEIIITGGEPFLRKDLLDILKIINKHSKASIGITTNGILTETILSITEEALKLKIPLSIYVSLDGSNSRIYNSIRGLKNGFPVVLNTLKRLSNLKKEFSQLDVDIGTTIVSQNLENIFEIKKLINSINNNFGFGVRIAENSGLFHNKEQKFILNQKKVVEILKKLKDGKIDFYYENIIKFIKTDKYPIFSCTACKNSLYLLPNGDFSICSKHIGGVVLGNIKNQKIEDILQTDPLVEKKIKNCKGCLDPCQWSWAFNQLAI